MMRIAFSGTHRSGKTSLASDVANKLKIPFIPMEVSKMPVWKNSGISPTDANAITFAERLAIQFQILDYMENALMSMYADKGGFITDRSPLDIFGYLLAGVDGTCSQMYDQDVMFLRNECRRLCNEFFDIVFVVHRLPQDVYANLPGDKRGKIYDSLAYRLLVSSVIESEASTLTCDSYLIPEMITNYGNRLKWALNLIEGNGVE